MINITSKDFYESHYACPEGKRFALKHKTMAEVWAACPRADWLIWILERTGHKLDLKTLRLFACWCVRETPIADGRKVWDLLTDERSRNAVIVSERFANGEATEEERVAARDAAESAAESAAEDAAEDAAESAAAFAAGSAAEDAASFAARDAAESAASASEDAGKSEDAGESESRAQAFQADRFRTLFKNPFQN